MTDGFQADPGELASMASMLRDAGSALDSAGSGMPGTPDAGEVTADLTAVMSHLADSAGELVLAVSAAGDAVAQGGTDYAAMDSSGRQSFQQPR